MTDQPIHPILSHADRVRRSMMYRDRRLLAKLTRDYLAAYRSLKSQIKTLTAAIAEIEPTKGQLLRIAALQSLLDGVKREIGDLAAIMGKDLEEAIKFEIQQAGVDTLRAVQLWLPGMEEARLTAMWTRLNPPQVYQMYGFLDEAGPLFSSLKLQFADDIANLIRDTLMTGYIEGMNPRTIAALINKSFGTGLNWALRTARTSTLWAYRSASQINYANNTNVVKGWLWMAQLDDRVCLSCVANHGKEFPVTEVLADHHRGRCAPLPITRSWAELGIEGIDERPFEMQMGEDWFNSLSPETQRQIMGPAKYKAWTDGAFDFSQLSQPYNDPIYGLMLREASLKSILKDGALQYYASTKALTG